jgi:L-threonylcarbamoyladenylate synthase
MKVPPPAPDLDLAVELLKRGRLVAFPTETVYGLGADATRSDAVGKIFSAKGRPTTNPLIVHVPDARVARRYVRIWTENAQKLSEAFWPGPLTLVLPKSDAIAAEVTAGLSSLGLRAPNHPLALELLKKFDGPVAAPSANRANRVSPTTAQHVLEELGDAVDLVLDGGPCRVGIESTVLDLTTDPPAVLRPGGVTSQQIERVIGPVRFVADKMVEAEPAPSPGMGSVHYAPVIPAWRFTSDQRPRVVKWLDEHPSSRAAALLIGSGFPAATSLTGRVIVMAETPLEYARLLYSALRDADRPPATDILIELPPDKPEWAAIHDRLRRATRPLPL